MFSVAVFGQILQVECAIISWWFVCLCGSNRELHLVEDPLQKCGRIHSHSTPCHKFMKFILRFINEEYVGLLDPRDQYRLAATESETWKAFVLRRYEERLVVERYWEMVDEGWFSD